MAKKMFIFILLLFFMNSLIVPNITSAMGQSSFVSDEVGWGLLAGFVIFMGIVYYKSKTSTESKKEKDEKKVSKKKLKRILFLQKK